MRNPRPLIALTITAPAALAAPAAGSVATDFGRVAPQGATLADCLADSGHSTSIATGTNPYVAPVGGIITEWRFRADVNPGTRKHTFAVRAVDDNGNKSNEADYRWKVKPKEKAK